jgi:hypothetical protein
LMSTTNQFIVMRFIHKISFTFIVNVAMPSVEDDMYMKGASGVIYVKR